MDNFYLYYRNKVISLYSLINNNNMDTQTNVSRETQKVKDLVKSKIDQLLSNQIDYEWNGTDFTNDLTNELYDEKNEKNVTLVHTRQTVQLDEKLYETFVNHLTEVVMSGIQEGGEY